MFVQFVDTRRRRIKFITWISWFWCCKVHSCLTCHYVFFCALFMCSFVLNTFFVFLVVFVSPLTLHTFTILVLLRVYASCDPRSIICPTDLCISHISQAFHVQRALVPCLRSYSICFMQSTCLEHFSCSIN